ncbi:MAG: lactonase family protein, partial [Planctomyces sp.]
KFAYTNNETTLVATAFRRDPVDGSLTVIQDISTLPEAPKPGMSTAECLVHPNGEFLYVSNRGHESIAVFSIESQTGLLTHVQNSPTGGKEPRNFVIDPSGRWILAENQNSDSIHVLAIDQQTGRLSLTGNSITVGRPVCIRMMPVP